MSSKANIAINDRELTVYFHTAHGGLETCHYCEKMGEKKMAVIENVETAQGDISPDTELFKEAKKLIERGVNHGRSVCYGSTCLDKFFEDREY